MEIVERILAKIVGQEIGAEELAEIAGGMMNHDPCAGLGYITSRDGGRVRCDS